MTLERLYEIADKLGMIDESQKVCSADDISIRLTTKEDFIKHDCSDLVSIMNFVDELTLYNDLETVKRLLVAIIFDMKNEVNI